MSKVPAAADTLTWLGDGILQRVAAVEGERSVVGDIAGDAAGSAAIADLQRAGADRRPTGVGVGTGENERTGTRLGECTGAADHATISQRIAAIEHQRGV